MDIQELTIILDSGLCFYTKSQKSLIECTVFGGVLTALNSVAQEIGVDVISSIILNKTLYTFNKTYNLLFALRTDTGAKPDQIRKLFVIIKRIFFRHFPPEQYWVKHSATPVYAIRLEPDDRVGNITYTMDQRQRLDAEFNELFIDLPGRMSLESHR